MSRQAPDHQRAIAECNVESILDAAERLLQRGSQATIAAVAAEAAVSRVTVYAHFPTRERLLKAALDRAIRRRRARHRGSGPVNAGRLPAASAPMVLSVSLHDLLVASAEK